MSWWAGGHQLRDRQSMKLLHNRRPVPRRLGSRDAHHWTPPAATIALLLAPGASVAAEAWRSSFSVTPVWQGDAELDRGGDFDATGIAIRVGTSTGFGAGHRAGVAFNYDYLDHDFSRQTAFGDAPWGEVQRFGFGAPLLFNGAGGWLYGVTPSRGLESGVIGPVRGGNCRGRIARGRFPRQQAARRFLRSGAAA